MTETPKKRPICINCGNELVFCSIVAGRHIFNAWLCDCDEQPDGIAADIVQAREWDEKALVYELEAVNPAGPEDDDD